MGLGTWTGRAPLALLVAGGLLGLGWAIPGVQAQGLGLPGQGPVAQAAAGLGSALGKPWAIGMGFSDQRLIAAMIPHHQGAIAMAELASSTGTDLAALSRAQDFDRAFLSAMVAHHRMGVIMAAMAQIHTRHLELLDLEQAMVRVQSSEINQMEAWARQWFGAP